jgi:virginiamycin B lyase
MPTRRSLIALSLLVLGLLGAFADGSAAAPAPGEIMTYGAPHGCIGTLVAPAVQEGVLVRPCQGDGAETLSANGQLTPFPAAELPEGPTVVGPAGEVWIGPEEGEFLEREPVIVRIAADGSVARFPIPVPDAERELVVAGLAIGAEGNLWAAIGEGGTLDPPFTYSVGGELLRLTPAGEETFFPVPEGIEPRGIALGVEGNLWFTGVKGYVEEEHTRRAGVGWIGRMTPAGVLTLFRTPNPKAVPTAIAASPAGALSYVEASRGDLGTIHPDGSPGRQYEMGGVMAQSLVFGPEGDAWTSFGAHLARVTPAGQLTRFPVSVSTGPTVFGPEGDVWVGGWKTVTRVVPGGPGLDILRSRADSRSRTVTVRLFCGGSKRGCRGVLSLMLETPGRRAGSGDAKQQYYRFGHTPYAIAAESRGTVRIKVPARAIAVANRFPPPHRPEGRVLIVRATVAGGPGLSELVFAEELF